MYHEHIGVVPYPIICGSNGAKPALVSSNVVTNQAFMSGENKISEQSKKGRGTTRPGQEGLKHPHLAGSENGALYEIRELRRHDIDPRHPFRLFFRRKNGPKFKKSFRTHEEAEWHMEAYFRLCCPHCLGNGIVQKVCDIGGIRDGISNFPRDHIAKPSWRFHPNGRRGECLVCHRRYEVYYEGALKKLRLVSRDEVIEREDCT